MIYSVVVWGFDIENDYQHDCDMIKAKSFQEAFVSHVTVISVERK